MLDVTERPPTSPSIGEGGRPTEELETTSAVASDSVIVKVESRRSTLPAAVVTTSPSGADAGSSATFLSALSVLAADVGMLKTLKSTSLCRSAGVAAATGWELTGMENGSWLSGTMEKGSAPAGSLFARSSGAGACSNKQTKNTPECRSSHYGKKVLKKWV